MRTQLSTTAVVLLSGLTIAQECPAGYARSGTISWVNCPVTENAALQCAELEVPFDWTKPPGSSEKFNLRLVRNPAAPGTKDAKSIIMNPGGPGESGVKMVVGGGPNWQKRVGDNFHIVGFDPRGVGFTTPYTCPSVMTNVGALNTDAGLNTTLESFKTQAKKCAEPAFKSDLVGTAFVARDIKAIADALGEDNLIRFWGFSYGTLLGATLAAMFPDQVDRFVLDGNINPMDYYYGIGAEAAASFDKGVSHLFNQCAEAGSKFCAVAVAGQDGTSLQATFDAFLAKLDHTQAKLVRDALSVALGFPSPTAFTDFAKLLAGYYKDPASIGKQSPEKRQLSWKPDEEATSSTDLMVIAISSGDVVDRIPASLTNYQKWLAEYEAVSKYGGDIAITNQLFSSAWTVQAKEVFRGAFSGIKTKHPILFVNTLYDPVTPLVSANSSSTGFVGSRVLVSSGVGHTSIVNESPDLNSAIKTYMNDGTFPVGDVVYAPKIKNVFNRLAKRNVDVPMARSLKVEYPAFFENEFSVARRADVIPAGCTKISASSTPAISTSSSARVSSSSSASITSANSSAPPSSVASVPASSPSLSGSTPLATATTKPTFTFASASSSLSNAFSASSQTHQASLSPSETSNTSSFGRSDSLSSSLPGASMTISRSLYETTTVPGYSGLSTGSTRNGTPTQQQQDDTYSVATSIPIHSLSSQPSYFTSTPSHSAPHKMSSASSYDPYSSSSATSGNYGHYDDWELVTPTPFTTQVWASQSGCVPETKIYTTKTVQTITKCKLEDKSCPNNSATPTLIVTETKTGTIIVAVPTTTVYVTRIVDICSTGLQTSTATITQTCSTGCTARPTGVPQGYATTMKYCDACATPSMVTVTYCTACVDNPSSLHPLKSLPLSTTALPSATPSKPLSSAKVSSVPAYGMPSSAVVNPLSPGYAVQSGSKAVDAMPSQPTKPFVIVPVNSTIVKSTPAVGTVSTPTTSTTLRMSAASNGVYGCSAGNCVAAPTASKPVEFTGATLPSAQTSLFVVIFSSILAVVVILL